LLDDYTEAVRKAFAAVVEGLDLTDTAETKRVIDQWAADHTEGMIKDLVGPDFFADMPLNFVLGDAVYFKGNWAEPFNPRYTNKSDFHLADGSTVQASIMNNVSGFNAYHGTGFDMVVLPYQGARFSMLVLLPNATDGLDELVQAVTPELLNQWAAEATGQMGGTWVALPKFAFSTRLETDDLKVPLETLGMTDVFSPVDADLSGMMGPGNGLHLKRLVHGARVEVSEEGTRAAGVSLGNGGVCAGPFYFTADHPFMFAIRDDQTGAIQFLGQVTNPNSAD
jgi:serpin B